jgi:alpha-galactosidase
MAQSSINGLIRTDRTNNGHSKLLEIKSYLVEIKTEAVPETASVSIMKIVSTIFRWQVFVLFVLTLAIRTFAAENSDSASFKDCYASWNDSELTVGNSTFERKWVIENGRLKASTFCTKNPDFEWVTESKVKKNSDDNIFMVVADHGQFSPTEAESLRLKLTIRGKTSQQLELKIFPETPGTIIISDDTSNARQASAAIQVSGVEHHETSPAQISRSSDAETLSIAPRHLKLTAVTLVDQTDAHNELVSEKEWLLAPNESPFELSGNILFLEDPATEQGLVFLKLAPCHQAHPDNSPWDFSINPGMSHVSAHSGGYPIATLAYQGGRAGRIAALQNFQRQLRVPDFSRDGVFLSNTWGDRSRDARINEPFILKEIAAGRRLGVDVVQIDDGWQKGRSKNSARQGGVWSGWWAADSQFWTPDTNRFPRGLKPVVEAAKQQGMKIGLWFSPDSSNQATNWQRDAECILKFYHELGIQYFKIDGLDTGNPVAAENERRLFDYVLRSSSNNVVFDLDVTAGNRPGYFGLPEIGPIFVENRYTDWRNYWPHQTLRNLWKLSQYVDPLRLRIEFLNNLRNATNYGNDTLAPVNYRPDTLFAMTMAANPLGWFEVSNLASNQVAEISPLVSVWNQERARFLGGTIIPVGNAPDGVAWTGFASVAADHSGGYLLLFREQNASHTFDFNLASLFPAEMSATILAGRGTIRQQGHQLSVTIPGQLDYLWVRLDRIGTSQSSSSPASGKTTEGP